MLVGDVVVSNARNHPDKLGLISEQGTRLTWKEVNSRVNKLANALLALGLRKGDRLAMISENCCQYAEFYSGSQGRINRSRRELQVRGKRTGIDNK